jgi:superfamily II DNA or RNA helicase
MIMHATPEEQATDPEKFAGFLKDLFNFRFYQKDDLARAAMQDGAIIAWDPGLGKTMALFTWPMLKRARRVIIVAPAALHEQIIDEGRIKFGVTVRPLPDQETALQYMRAGILPFPGSSPSTIDPQPSTLPDYFITAYNWLGYNGGDEWTEEKTNELIRNRRLRIAAGYLNLSGDTSVILSATYRPQEMQDAWTVLGIARNSDTATIKAGWKNAAKLYHPDLHPGDATATARFQLLNAAFRKLMGLDDREFDNQLKALQGEKDLRTAIIAVTVFEAGIGTVKNYPSSSSAQSAVNSSSSPSTLNPQPSTSSSIRCVFKPTLATLIQTTFDCVVCDEAVRVKSGTAYQAEGVLRLEARYRLALTGTPIKNKLPDIFFLASFVTGHQERGTARWPYGNTIADRAQFASDFGVMEVNLTKEEESRVKGESRKFTKTTAKICNVHRLWRILGPVVIRRRKDDVPGCDIVGKTIVPVRVMPGTAQNRVYQYQLANPPPHDGNFLAELGAQLQCLRQTALFPASPSLRRPGILESSSPERFTPKSAGILQLATDLMEVGEQLVIFSPFTDFSDDLSQRFTEAGVPHLKLDGSTSPTKRGQQIKRFKSGAVPILIAGINSMGEGHNLDNASHLVLPSVDWAFDSNSQAVERVHRLTSRKDVTIYVMVTKGTIDEKLTALWQEKGDSSDLALDGRLIEHEREEIDLGKLLNTAFEDFDPTAQTIDESEVRHRWATTLAPALTAAWLTYQSLRVPGSAEPQLGEKPKPSTPITSRPTPHTAPLASFARYSAPAGTRPNLFDLMKSRQSSPPTAPTPEPATSSLRTPHSEIRTSPTIIPFPGPLAKVQPPRKIPVVMPDILK